MQSSADRLSIGEMAKLNQITTETLRHYEKIGLILPDYIDKDTNYRFYNIEQSMKLDIIIRLKNMGMSLIQIKEQLENEDISFFQATLNEQLKYIENKISEYEQIRTAIQKSIDKFENFCRAPKAPEITIEHIPARRILVYDNKLDFNEIPFSEFEYATRDLKKTVTKNKLPILYFSNVGDLIRKQMLEQNKFVISEVFIEIYNKEIVGHVELVPESDYCCIYFDNYHDEIENIKHLLNFIYEKGYLLNGDLICEVVADLPYFKKLDRKLYMKAQIPIIKDL